MSKFTHDKFQVIDKVRQDLIEDFAMKTADDKDSPDYETLAAAFMLQGFQFLLFENASEKWMRDEYLSLAEKLSRSRLNEIGFDVE